MVCLETNRVEHPKTFLGFAIGKFVRLLDLEACVYIRPQPMLSIFAVRKNYISGSGGSTARVSGAHGERGARSYNEGRP